MYVLNTNENIHLVDVDDTLVSFIPLEGAPELTIEFDGRLHTFYVIENEVKNVIYAKLRGHFVRVASQGGYAWAQLIVDRLGLGPYVDSIETKPKWYHDDLPADAWMTRVFIGHTKK